MRTMTIRPPVKTMVTGVDTRVWTGVKLFASVVDIDILKTRAGVERKYCDWFQRLLEEQEKGFVLRLRVERVISLGKSETRRKVRCA